MDKALAERILAARKKSGRPFEITVTGASMNPALYDGDIITVTPQSDYFPGDILVFSYKQGELLVHRLLLKKDGRYFCKGDNSFRLEDVSSDQITGKVTAANGKEIPTCSERLTILSYAVSRAFRRLGYDAEKTKQTDIYRLYEKIILQKGESIMAYRKNMEMEYIPVDETSLTVFDPETGDAHFFDATGIDILDLLDEPQGLDSLLEKLCEIYEAESDAIKADVEEFLADAVSKKIILEL